MMSGRFEDQASDTSHAYGENRRAVDLLIQHNVFEHHDGQIGRGNFNRTYKRVSLAFHPDTFHPDRRAAAARTYPEWASLDEETKTAIFHAIQTLKGFFADGG